MKKTAVYILIITFAAGSAGQGYLPLADADDDALRPAALAVCGRENRLFSGDRHTELYNTSKSSSGGINVSVDKTAEVFSYAGVSEKKAISDVIKKYSGSSDLYYNLLSMIAGEALNGVTDDTFSEYKKAKLLALKKALKKSKGYDEIFKAARLALLGSIDQDMLCRCKKVILPVFRRNLNGKYRLLSAVGLAAISTVEKSILYKKHRDAVLYILKRYLDGDYRLQAAVGMAFLCSIDDNIMLKYKESLLALFSSGLKSGNQQERLLSMIGFAAIKKKGSVLRRVSIDYPGRNRPYILLTGGTQKLADRLNRDILIRLGISCVYVSETKLVILSTVNDARDIKIADLTVEGELENALRGSIHNSLYRYTASAKNSAAGVNGRGVTYGELGSSDWYRDINAFLADTAGIHSGETILEIGAGPGASTAVLLDRLGRRGRIIALEPNLEYMNIASKSLRGEPVELMPASAEELKDIFREDIEVDSAFIFNAIHLIDGHRALFGNLADFVKPGGILAFNTAYFQENHSEYRKRQRRIMVKLLRSLKETGKVIVTKDRNRLHVHSLKHYEEALKDYGFKIIELKRRKVNIPFSDITNFYRDRTVTDYIAPSLSLSEREEFIMKPVKKEIDSVRSQGGDYIEGEWLYIVAKNSGIIKEQEVSVSSPGILPSGKLYNKDKYAKAVLQAA